MQGKAYPQPLPEGKGEAYPRPLPEGKGDKKRKKMKEITMIKRQRLAFLLSAYMIAVSSYRWDCCLLLLK